MNYFTQAIKQYADFGGRTARKDFWMFVLFYIIISFVLTLIDMTLGFNYEEINFLSSIFALFMLIPSLAISVRRLHDVGKSGWMILVGLIPLIGFFWLLYLFIQESK